VAGVDASPPLLALARERLAPDEGRYETVTHDITDIATLRLPQRDYQIAISVQTTHNVPDRYKREAFEFIYKTLQPGGLFLLMDRIAIDTPALYDLYKILWKH